MVGWWVMWLDGGWCGWMVCGVVEWWVVWLDGEWVVWWF